MKNRIITIAAIASFAFAPAAIASDKFEFDFDFSPVEVGTEIGAEQVYEELEAMIEKKCEPENGRARIFNRVETEECIDNTIEQAVAEIDEPELTEVHNSRRG